MRSSYLLLHFSLFLFSDDGARPKAEIKSNREIPGIITIVISCKIWSPLLTATVIYQATDVNYRARFFYSIVAAIFWVIIVLPRVKRAPDNMIILRQSSYLRRHIRWK